MRQKLKCIGGSCDGLIFDAEFHGIGDQVRVPGKIEFHPDTFQEALIAYREGRVPEHAIIPYHYYKVEAFYFNSDNKSDNIKILIPLHWTIKDAIIHKFSCS